MASNFVQVPGVANLRLEIERTKDNLKDVEENIKKLTGRELLNNRFGQRQLSRSGPDDVRGKGNLFGLAGYGGMGDVGMPPAKRQAMTGAFGRLGPRVTAGRQQPGRRRDSGDEEELPHKLSLHSSVIATPKDDTISRQQAIAQQSMDDRGKARNRRMFGLLNGTLQRFKVEEQLKGDKEKQRKAVEQRLEDKQKDEIERERQERAHLFRERRNKQMRLQMLERKMELAQIHAEWEAQTRNLLFFIRTDSKPPIYFLPKSHTVGTLHKLDKSKRKLQELLNERRGRLEEDIAELTRKEEESAKQPVHEDAHDDGGDSGADDVEDGNHHGEEAEQHEAEQADVPIHDARIVQKKSSEAAYSDLEEENTGVAVDEGEDGQEAGAVIRHKREKHRMVVDDGVKSKEGMSEAPSRNRKDDWHRDVGVTPSEKRDRREDRGRDVDSRRRHRHDSRSEKRSHRRSPHQNKDHADKRSVKHRRDVSQERRRSADKHRRHDRRDNGSSKRQNYGSENEPVESAAVEQEIPLPTSAEDGEDERVVVSTRVTDVEVNASMDVENVPVPDGTEADEVGADGEESNSSSDSEQSDVSGDEDE